MKQLNLTFNYIYSIGSVYKVFSAILTFRFRLKLMFTEDRGSKKNVIGYEVECFGGASSLRWIIRLVKPEKIMTNCHEYITNYVVNELEKGNLSMSEDEYAEFEVQDDGIKLGIALSILVFIELIRHLFNIAVLGMGAGLKRRDQEGKVTDTISFKDIDIDKWNLDSRLTDKCNNYISMRRKELIEKYGIDVTIFFDFHTDGRYFYNSNKKTIRNRILVTDNVLYEKIIALKDGWRVHNKSKNRLSQVIDELRKETFTVTIESLKDLLGGKDRRGKDIDPSKLLIRLIDEFDVINMSVYQHGNALLDWLRFSDDPEVNSYVIEIIATYTGSRFDEVKNVGKDFEKTIMELVSKFLEMKEKIENSGNYRDLQKIMYIRLRIILIIMVIMIVIMRPNVTKNLTEAVADRLSLLSNQMNSDLNVEPIDIIDTAQVINDTFNAKQFDYFDLNTIILHALTKVNGVFKQEFKKIMKCLKEIAYLVYPYKGKMGDFIFTAMSIIGLHEATHKYIDQIASCENGIGMFSKIEMPKHNYLDYQKMLNFMDKRGGLDHIKVDFKSLNYGQINTFQYNKLKEMIGLGIAKLGGKSNEKKIIIYNDEKINPLIKYLNKELYFIENGEKFNHFIKTNVAVISNEECKKIINENIIERTALEQCNIMNNGNEMCFYLFLRINHKTYQFNIATDSILLKEGACMKIVSHFHGNKSGFKEIKCLQDIYDDIVTISEKWNEGFTMIFSGNLIDFKLSDVRNADNYFVVSKFMNAKIDYNGLFCKENDKIGVINNQFRDENDVKSRNMMFIRTNDELMNFHDVPHHINLDAIQEQYLSKAIELENCKGYDHAVKLKMMNIIFEKYGEKFNNLKDINDCKFEKVILGDRNTNIDYIMSQEKGRFIGFEHNNKVGLEKIKQQIATMEIPPSNMFIKEYINNRRIINEVNSYRKRISEFGKLYANMCMRLPMNSSAGSGNSKTNLQFALDLDLKNVRNCILDSDRNGYISDRLDQGGKYRLIYVRNAIVKIGDIMGLNHLYEGGFKHPGTTMSSDMMGIHDKIFKNSRIADGVFMCVDFAKFDMHLSMMNLMGAKRIFFNREVPFSEEHLEKEEYVYKVISGKSKIILNDRADKLMTGDYLTSIGALLFQVQRGNELDSIHPKIAEPLAMIGDDFVGKVSLNRVYDVYKYFEHQGDEISMDKTLIHPTKALFNRRIGDKNTYPFNNYFTLINSICRSEKMNSDKTQSNWDTRGYNIGTTYIAGRVINQFNEHGDRLVEEFDKFMLQYKPVDVQCYNLYQQDIKQREIRNQPNIDTETFRMIKPYIRDLKKEFPFYDLLLKGSYENILKRYYNEPYFDKVEQLYHRVVEGDKIRIDTNKKYFAGLGIVEKMPFHLREDLYKNLFMNYSEGESAFFDCLSRLQLPIRPLGVFEYSDVHGLVQELTRYICMLFPLTSEIKYHDLS